MFNYIKTMKFVLTVNSPIYGGLCLSLLTGKFVNFGRVMLSSNITQESKLKYVTKKYKLLDFNTIKSTVPKKFWKEKSDFIVNYSFVIHKKTAGEIAAAVMDSVSKKTKEAIVIELNPGLGLITKNLFERGLRNLVVYDQCCFQPFKNILSEHTTNIKLHDKNPFDMRADLNANMYYKFLHDIADMGDNEIIIVGISPNRLFFRRLMYFITNFSISSCKNVEFYITIPNRIYHCLMSLDDMNARVTDYGCFGVLFDLEILNNYPRQYFLPLSVSPDAPVIFAKLTRKSQTLSKEDLLLYTNFLKIIGSKKSNYVIGELEKWFPGSGPHLIAKGVSATNQTFEFKTDDLFRLFKSLQQFGGYEDSLFLMRTYDSNPMEFNFNG